MNTSDVVVFDVVNKLWKAYKKVCLERRRPRNPDNEREGAEERAETPDESDLPYADEEERELMPYLDS